MCASCIDGMGGTHFEKLIVKGSVEEIDEYLSKIPPKETIPEQWCAQIYSRILKKHTVILVTTYLDHDLVRKANMQVNKLHRHAAGLVKAEKQSAMIEILEPLFTEEEKQIYKRGRNAKSYTKAKNASTIDYRRATGFEAVMGYLYLKGDYKRMIDLIRAGLGEV